ncbi:DUF2807 domain-containing protein [Catellatospora sp. NPDC049609]|uniref:GIN domain-containing protein n=1 Tax=Catellatospora sp. NPDC049609 TaxID=3155505 RepID=UPI0034200CDD
MSDKTYRATKLRLADLPGTVRVVPGRRSREMVLTLTGPQKQLDEIRHGVNGDTLVVSGPARGRGGVNITMSGRGGVTSISNMSASGMVVFGNGVHISGANGPIVVNGNVITPGGGTEGYQEITVTVEVPVHTSVAVDDSVGGTYVIGDTLGTLDLRLKAHSQVQAGQVAETRIDITGSGDVQIGSITGKAAELSITGSGDVRIAHGQVERFDAGISGSGSVAFAGTAGDANLSISGSGNMRLDTVTRHLADRVSGSGRIDVRVRPQRSSGSFWS